MYIIPRTSVALALFGLGLTAQGSLEYSWMQVTGDALCLQFELPSEQARIILDSRSNLASAAWQAQAVQRPVAGQSQTWFSVTLPPLFPRTRQFQLCAIAA